MKVQKMSMSILHFVISKCNNIFRNIDIPLLIAQESTTNIDKGDEHPVS